MGFDLPANVIFQHLIVKKSTFFKFNHPFNQFDPKKLNQNTPKVWQTHFCYDLMHGLGAFNFANRNTAKYSTTYFYCAVL